MKSAGQSSAQGPAACLEATYGRVGVRCLDWYSVGLMGACLWIGMRQSSGAGPAWLTSYGGDVVCPMFLQWSLRRLAFPCARLGAELAAALTFGACVLWEVLQRFDLAGTPLGLAAGTFDPFDFAAYGLSLALGLGVDRVARRP